MHPPLRSLRSLGSYALHSRCLRCARQRECRGIRPRPLRRSSGAGAHTRRSACGHACACDRRHTGCPRRRRPLAQGPTGAVPPRGLALIIWIEVLQFRLSVPSQPARRQRRATEFRIECIGIPVDLESSPVTVPEVIGVSSAEVSLVPVCVIMTI